MISLSTPLIRQAGLRWTPSQAKLHLVFLGGIKTSDRSAKERPPAIPLCYRRDGNSPSVSWAAVPNGSSPSTPPFLGCTLTSQGNAQDGKGEVCPTQNWKPKVLSTDSGVDPITKNPKTALAKTVSCGWISFSPMQIPRGPPTGRSPWVSSHLTRRLALLCMQISCPPTQKQGLQCSPPTWVAQGIGP